MIRVFGARLVSQRTIVVLNKSYTSDKTGQTDSSPPSSQQPPKKDISNVPGLSKNVCDVPNHPVGFRGSKKDSEYKNPEYFCYHVDSFADAFIEMDQFRLPAPANPNKKM